MLIVTLNDLETFSNEEKEVFQQKYDSHEKIVVLANKEDKMSLAVHKMLDKDIVFDISETPLSPLAKLIHYGSIIDRENRAQIVDRQIAEEGVDALKALFPDVLVSRKLDASFADAIEEVSRATDAPAVTEEDVPDYFGPDYEENQSFADEEEVNSETDIPTAESMFITEEDEDVTTFEEAVEGICADEPYHDYIMKNINQIEQDVKKSSDPEVTFAALLDIHFSNYAKGILTLLSPYYYELKNLV